MVFSGFVVWNSSVPRCCSCFYDVAGVTLWPFVFVRYPEPSAAEIDADARAGGDLARRVRAFVRHERIHLAQATEMGVLPFYALWLGDFVCGMRERPGGTRLLLFSACCASSRNVLVV